jgi:hypothetical protein
MFERRANSLPSHLPFIQRMQNCGCPHANRRNRYSLLLQLIAVIIFFSKIGFNGDLLPVGRLQCHISRAYTTVAIRLLEPPTRSVFWLKPGQDSVEQLGCDLADVHITSSVDPPHRTVLEMLQRPVARAFCSLGAENLGRGYKNKPDELRS